jgi:hypothetical protein
MSKKFYQELMSAEPGFVHWDCAQNMEHVMDQHDFDYACAAVTLGAPLDPACGMEPIYRCGAKSRTTTRLVVADASSGSMRRKRWPSADTSKPG